MSEVPALEVDKLTVIYNKGTPNETIALRDFSMVVQRGEAVLISGDNGSGKSTLLNAVAGTVPTESGTMILLGQDVTGQPDFKRSRRIGFVHQDPLMGTCPSLTVFENARLADFSRIWSLSPYVLSPHLHEFMTDEFSNHTISTKLNSKVAYLSGGQRQLIAFLLFLSSKRPILLLDEFMSALDGDTKEHIAGMLARDIATHQRTYLIVSHDEAALAHVFSRKVLLRGSSR